MATRTADYAIEGFLYQFNKTLLEILKGPDDAQVTVEGIIEDIEIAGSGGIRAIQCKYHGTKEKFTLSAIYKPLLQMLSHHGRCNSAGLIRYHLFAHFPNESEIKVDQQAIKNALATEDKNLKAIAKEAAKADIPSFLKCFTAEVGKEFSGLIDEVCCALKEAGFTGVEVETLAYPNAIQIVADTGICHDVALRRITRRDLLKQLKETKTTAISHWTRALATRSKLLSARRAQLRAHLGQNARSRYFVIDKSALEDFDDRIVIFIKDYIEKYHHKPSHIKTPTFCLSVSDIEFNSLSKRLAQKSIQFNDGKVANEFMKSQYIREPIVTKHQREFSLRLLQWSAGKEYLEQPKPDDLFVFGEMGLESLDVQDVTVERLGTDSFDELYFLMGLRDAIG